ncbi:DUF6447 family protein [Marinobacterium arenosum]|uniref:DUF6447 family protein n=1 Tax=Marinobacterium arenosum TaxID=2862496 RepID=UPI001C989F0F|nr:DUF6447 family protein [Marinobacterium arenosum]MBY4679056.1 DUF6447 family protein [Marinobacterium arenosum]
MSDNAAKLTVDGREYLISELSPEAQADLQSLQFAKAEVQRLQAQLALAQTAANAYQQALIAKLPQ